MLLWKAHMQKDYVFRQLSPHAFAALDTRISSEALTGGKML